MKRKITKHRRTAHRNVLQVRVMSPRIAWFGFLRVLGSFTKLALVLAAITGISWGIWRGVRQAFHQNPDFRLQVIDLNPNLVIDELGVAAEAGIDLTQNPSIFCIDVSEAVAKLKALPYIKDARIERHMPGTLVVRIVPRTAKAWISHPGSPTARTPGSILVDEKSIAFPCPQRLAESAAQLPAIEIPSCADHPVMAGKKVTHPELEQCFLLLESAAKADPQSHQWIESVRKANTWSLELLTRQGTRATFALGDHSRQIDSLRAALDHAGENGLVLDTINLIPKNNIPVTLSSTTKAPRAIPVPSSQTAPSPANRRARDLDALLKRP